MIKEYEEKVIKHYEYLRQEETNALAKRRAEIEKKLPWILELEKRIGKLCVDMSLQLLRPMEDKEKFLEERRKEITVLRAKMGEGLCSSGYEVDYLTHRYNCIHCKDTGYVGSVRCSCFKKQLVRIYFEGSPLKPLLKINNFDTFNLEYFSPRRDGEKESARKNMDRNVSLAWSFINTFNEPGSNLLFYGNSGTGKTFLSYCIAKELLDKGYLVVYKTSDELLKDLKQIRFNDGEALEELLLQCDLLIIDDLGTEPINDFSKTELFNLLNKRLLGSKKMIVSTNHTLETLSLTYSERITSRLFGNFTLLKFFGDDIRVKLNLSKTKQL